MQLNPELLKELDKELSLTRLTKVGLFRRLDLDGFEPIEREIILHRSVLDKALIDWFSDNKVVKKDVDDWLYLTNPDFTEACERAELKPEKVFEMFQLVRSILKGDKAKLKKFNLKKSV